MHKLFLFFLLTLFFSNLVVATEYHTLFEPADLRLSISNNGTVTGVSANITVRDPDKIVLVPFGVMSNTVGTTDWNYTVPASQITKTGQYEYTVCSYSPVENRCDTFEFKVNPAGREQTSILENPLLLVFGIIGTLFLVFGVWQGNSIFGFIGAIMFILGGVYTMIYGFNGEQSLYTQGIAMTIIGTGFIFMFLSAYEWLGWGSYGGDEDED